MRLLPVLLLLPAPALADDCALRLQTLLATDLTADGPYTAMNTNVMAGAEQVYQQSFVSDRHFLVETISPPGLPATLHFEGSAWHADGAGGWTLAWETDADEAAQGIEDQRQASGRRRGKRDLQSKATARSPSKARSGPRRISGRRQPWATWWTPPPTRCWRLSYAYVINGVPVTANYQISRAPGLTLPLPPGN
jgi:hypothetical protein